MHATKFIIMKYNFRTAMMLMAALAPYLTSFIVQTADNFVAVHSQSYMKGWHKNKTFGTNS